MKEERSLIRVDRNGTKYYHVECDCPDCNGTGYLPYYAHIDNGICYRCSGTGRITYEDKVMTAEYEAKLAERHKARVAKKEAELRSHVAEKNLEFFSKQGFTSDGIAYMILGNTYPIKDELKAAGFKFNGFTSHWYGPVDYSIDHPEYHTYKISADDLYKTDKYGQYYWNNTNWNQDLLSALKETESNIEIDRRKLSIDSNYIGKVGEKINIDVTLLDCKHFQTENNYSQWASPYIDNMVYTFTDNNGNQLVWYTSSNFKLSSHVNEKFHITAGVKDHKEYKGVKQTIITRCKTILLSD